MIECYLIFGLCFILAFCSVRFYGQFYQEREQNSSIQGILEEVADTLGYYRASNDGYRAHKTLVELKYFLSPDKSCAHEWKTQTIFDPMNTSLREEIQYCAYCGQEQKKD